MYSRGYTKHLREQSDMALVRIPNPLDSNSLDSSALEMTARQNPGLVTYKCDIFPRKQESNVVLLYLDGQYSTYSIL